MERLEVRFRPNALSDLEDIYRWVYRASLNPIIAERFTMRIVARCLKIGDAPAAGRPRDDLATGLRTIAFERRAVVAYLVTDTVEITNIFSGGRDYETLYRK
ncbi:MAG: hypothetical protein NVSMB26_18130 [Beijerinckiaceae bacterium]